MRILKEKSINRDVYYMLISLLSTTAMRGNPSLTTRWENRKTIMSIQDKQVSYNMCFKPMGSDIVKRHMKQHNKRKCDEMDKQYEKEISEESEIDENAKKIIKRMKKILKKRCVMKLLMETLLFTIEEV